MMRETLTIFDVIYNIFNIKLQTIFSLPKKKAIKMFIIKNCAFESNRKQRNHVVRKQNREAFLV